MHLRRKTYTKPHFDVQNHTIFVLLKLAAFEFRRNMYGFN